MHVLQAQIEVQPRPPLHVVPATTERPGRMPNRVAYALAAATEAVVLADGTRLRFRTLGSADRDGLVGLFAKLTFESRRRRYLSPKPALTSRELVFLTDIDHVSHEAIAAVDEHDGSIVGVARYVGVPGRPGVADVAVEVADEIQSMGVGTELVTHLVDRARANGFTLLTATTLWENRPARALLRRLGFRARASHAVEIELELELNPNDARVGDHTMHSEMSA